MRYVTYDPATGALTGCYLQDVLPEHAECFIEIPEEQAAVWVTLQANADRTGVEEIPPVLPPIPTLADLQGRLEADVTAKRWAVETGGLWLPGGVHILTGIEDQNRVTSVVANAHLAGVTEMDFKAASGWVTLTVEQIDGIAAAIALHVQAGYSNERAHHTAIAALETVEAAAEYDIGTGWPSNDPPAEGGEGEGEGDVP